MTLTLEAVRRWRPRGPVEWLAVPVGALIALAVFVLVAPLAPLESRLTTPGTVILDASGGVIDRDVAAGTRIPITLDRVSPVLVAATIAAEDQRFRSHPGVDPLAMLRAVTTLRSDPSGASTITQQLVRGVYLQDQSIPLPLRKVREALLALRLEAHTSKDQVLEAYLNEAYYGRGAYGVEAAARAYFGVAAADVDVAQAAFLAGLPRSPSVYDSPDGAASARERQSYVLGRMEATGVLSPERAEAAREADLRVAPEAPRRSPHLPAMVFDELRRHLPPEVIAAGGLVVETTLDAGLQREAEASVTRRLAALQQQQAGSAAVVVLDPRDGRLLALVGSADYAAKAGQINMALEPRQPGSALKPLLYAVALERGYTAASPVLDVPSTFATDGGPYTPVNYDLRFRRCPCGSRSGRRSTFRRCARSMTSACPRCWRWRIAPASPRSKRPRRTAWR
ncbi:MAG: transglycosylase domain-containing protein [Chloroflexi bacterium]|nr:transglycosylase domain-containing protein [Chloroflexota bacterium]